MGETEKYSQLASTATPYGVDLMDMRYLLWRAERTKLTPTNMYVGDVTLKDIIEKQHEYDSCRIDDNMKFMGVHVSVVPHAIGMMLIGDIKTQEEQGEDNSEREERATDAVQASEQRNDPAVDNMVGGQLVLHGVREGGGQAANHGADSGGGEEHGACERDVGGTTGGAGGESHLGEETEIGVRGVDSGRAWWGGFGRRARRHLADACKSLRKGRQ